VLDITLHAHRDTEAITQDFIRDGFACVDDALTSDQLSYGQEGARRIVADQTSAIELEDANRGYARYSFGSQI